MAKEAVVIEKRVMDFSRRPGPRYIRQGKDSGESFYVSCLKPWFNDAINNNCKLKVILDGTDGYLSSFIDEAFGRLIYDFGSDVVSRNLIVESNQEPMWLNKLNNKTFPSWEERRLKHEAPSDSFN